MKNTKMIPRLALVTFLSLGLVGCASIEKPFLYSIHKDGQTKAYVLGTIHKGVPAKELPSEVFEKFEVSKTLFIESYSPEYYSNAYAKLAPSIYKRKSDPSITTRLTKAERERLYKLLSDYRPSFLEGLNMQTINALLTEKYGGSTEVSSYEYYALNPKAGMDYKLTRLAEDKGKSVLALDRSEACYEEIESMALAGFDQGSA